METKNYVIDSKILIVDDSPEMIDVLNSILPKNIKRQIALNGINTMNILNKSSELPDLILLDILMPGMGGYEVSKNIKAGDRLKDIPIIFISSLNETFDKVKAFKSGGVDYITKPFQKEEVIARINTHLEIARSKNVIKELYSETIQGIIGIMNDMLAIANPQVAKVSNSMRLYAEMIMKELLISDTWDLKLTCVLSGLGMLSENIKKSEITPTSKINNDIDTDINNAYKSLATSNNIVRKIPKFEAVTNILQNSMNPLENEYRFIPAKDMKMEVLKGQILRILIYYLHRFEREKNHINIIEEMKGSKREFYSSDILDILEKVQSTLLDGEILDLNIHELRPRMIIVEDLYCPQGRLMLKGGYELSRETIILIRNFKGLKDTKLKVIEN